MRILSDSLKAFLIKQKEVKLKVLARKLCSVILFVLEKRIILHILVIAEFSCRSFNGTFNIEVI
jgi:hypothetical protein